MTLIYVKSRPETVGSQAVGAALRGGWRLCIFSNLEGFGAVVKTPIRTART
jgi:hypothetical protein